MLGDRRVLKPCLHPMLVGLARVPLGSQGGIRLAFSSWVCRVLTWKGGVAVAQLACRTIGAG